MTELREFLIDRFRWIAGARAGSAAVAQNVLVRIFILGINLSNSIVTARHLGPEGRGTQAVIGLWLSILTYFLHFSIPTALSFQGRKHPNERNSLFGASIVVGLSLGFLATIVGIAIIPFVIHKYGSATIRDAQYIMLFAPMSMLGLIFSAMLEVQFKFSLLNFTRYIPPIATLALLVSLSVVGQMKPMNVVLAYICPITLMTALMGIYLFKNTIIRLTDFARSTKRLFGYGIRIFGSELLAAFSVSIDQLLVVGFLSATQLGSYTIALQTSRVVNIFQTSLDTVLLPKAAGLATHTVVALVSRAARLTIAITILAGFALIALLPLLIRHFYGHDFGSAVIVAQILVVEAIFSAAASTHTQAFTATNRPGMATVFQVGGLLTAIPLMFLLLPRFGLVGAAFSLLGSSVLRLGLALASYPILLKYPVPNLLLTSSDIVYLRNTVLRRSTTAN